MSTIRDKTRIRKTYSYQRVKPGLDVDDSSTPPVDTTTLINGFFEGGWSPVARARDGSYITAIVSGDYNNGREFHYDNFAVASGNSIVGVRFWWPGGVGAQTIRCRLYSDAGTVELESVDVAVNAAGVYDGLFTTSILLTAAMAYTRLTVAIWETSGTYSITATNTSSDYYVEVASSQIAGSTGLYWGTWTYGLGNTDPVNISGENYPIEPIFDIV